MEKEQILSLLSQTENNDKEAVIRAFLSKLVSSQEDIISNEEKERLLFDSLKSYNISHTHNVGDLVQWKEGLKNKTRPGYGEPAIVVDVLSQAFNDIEAPVASPYHKENLDIKLAVIVLNDKTPQFLTFYYDKQRFEPYQKEKAYIEEQ